MRLQRILLALLLTLLVSTPLRAQSEPEDDEQSELESLLRQETELATRSRMNHDYVPGMVTVLQGDELETLGVRTVWEALSLVPGVQSVRDVYASPLVLVRGINFIFNSGNIKILVDSVPLNQESAGINSSILMMPIEDVERIEFMRGPGSAIQGDFAYLGLVNIITRREGRQVFASYGNAGLTAGAQFNASDPAQDRHWGIAVSGLSNRDLDGNGPSRFKEEKGFGRFFWRQRGLRFSLQAVEAERPVDDRGARYTESRLAAQAGYARQLSPSLHLESHLGMLRNEDHVAKETDSRSLYGGLDLRWIAPRGHTLLLSLGGSNATIERAALALPPFFDLRVVDVERRTRSVALQDQWNVNDRLTLTAGIRYDDLDVVDSRTTSRFAIVWRIDEHQILKTQYAEGFRSPGFWELYRTPGIPNPNLDSETIDTTELSYIFRHDRFVARATLYQSDLEDMIQPFFFIGAPFANAATAQTRGLELEWSQELTQTTRLSANVSWTDPEDERFTRDVLAASKWLGNLTFHTRLMPELLLAARWNHVGDRGTLAGSPAIDGYDVLDVTATSTALSNGLTLRGGVKNAFDDEVIYLTTLPPPLNPIEQQFGGRVWWGEVGWRF